MEVESLLRRKSRKTSKRSRSSSSESEEISGRKRHLKESKTLKCVKDSDERDGKINRSIKKGKRRNEKRDLESEKSDSSSGSERELRKKKKRKEKKQKKKSKRKRKVKQVAIDSEFVTGSFINEGQGGYNVVSGPMPEKSIEKPKRAPMTREEYEKEQSKIKRVFDPDTGRERLVKGDGEIVEEVVSHKRHKAINKISTLGDGAAFQKSLGLNRYTDDKIY